MSPEVIRSVGHNKAADYWSLGVLLYAMLNGREPFYGNATEDIFRKILYTPPEMKPFFSKNARLRSTNKSVES